MNRKPLSDGARLALALEEVQRLAVRYAASADGSEPYTLHFTVYGTDNKGLLRIEPRCGAAQYAPLLGVHRDGSDRLHANDLQRGTREALLAYLRRPDIPEEWRGTIRHLSARADAD